MTRYKNFIAGEVCPGLIPAEIHIIDLEQTVNEWFEKNPDIEVISMSQSPLSQSSEPGHWHYQVMVSIVYK